MSEDKIEGVAIANLIGTDERSIVGWVYRWNTGALAVRWDIDGPQRVLECRPDLSDAEKREIDFGGLTQIPTLDSWQDQL
ncbi:hypothetical protein G5B38_19980 (plasmid) [Pseudohalocynthiibacter aestuariivivens]|uniref:Uncharacterized protein n=1 Tax=Roseovarius pelagicus TaxID=2980108 RepID=A0ABY6D613_9RHOB|nr:MULTISPECIES: hypothetical protein [Rhodobacterales]QIE47898.1 hypothetical protein G5B38_19980 [Pseudohalocynthiibacter aestuariivivens]UXX81586.1 hypothetical protein N7U68_00555 [Roseovarius pelagicus]